MRQDNIKAETSGRIRPADRFDELVIIIDIGVTKASVTHKLMRYNGCMAIRFAASADKHGVPREDALYAMANALHSEREFDEPRVPGHGKPTLFIGPSRKLGGPLLEVMVEITPSRDMFIFHVMEARPKILERMKNNG